ncbi:hypothetical protein Tco_0363373 [Tanacetum coccineum]
MYYFGVILFQLLSGRLAVTYDEEGGAQLLSKLARSHYETGTLTEIIDPLLRVQMNRDSIAIFSEVAYRCLKSSFITISEVIEQLQKVLKLQQGFESSELQQMVDGLDVIKIHSVGGVRSQEYVDHGLTKITKELERIYTMLEELLSIIVGEASVHRNCKGRTYGDSRIRPTISESFDNCGRNHSNSAIRGLENERKD